MIPEHALCLHKGEILALLRENGAGIGSIPEDRQHDGIVGSMSVAENMVIEPLSVPQVQSRRLIKHDAIRQHADQLTNAYDVRGPSIHAAARLLSGAFDALQIRLQTEVGTLVTGQIFLMAPYILSIIALVIAARSADYPRALLTPWLKGQR